MDENQQLIQLKLQNNKHKEKLSNTPKDNKVQPGVQAGWDVAN